MSLPSFGVRKPVPVNLLMIAFIMGGIVGGLTMTREFFPDLTPESASINLPYPGATPEEIEETLALKVEDKIADLDEVDSMTTTLAEGGGGIVVEFRDGIDSISDAVNEVELAVESLLDLPDEAERIQVFEIEPAIPAIFLTLYGDAPEDVLKTTIREIKDDLKSMPGMGQIEITGTRDYEVRVDIDRDALLSFGISLPDIASRIRGWMTDIPGGTVRTNTGDFTVRTMGVEERSEAIRDIVVLATADGQVVRVRDIGTVSEGFVDELVETRFATHENAGPCATLTISKVGDQDAVEIAEMVRAYADARSGKPFEAGVMDRLGLAQRELAYNVGLKASPLPEGTSLMTHSDLARFIEGRLALLSRNAFWGMILVFATLLIFLNWRVAFWVGMGLATAMCGTLMAMNLLGVTLNLLTMFGLIIVLGLLVDDAIVVAENIQAWHDRKETSLVGAIKGAEEVFWPVCATVMTSIVAFLPLLLIKGETGDLMGALPWVVTIALLMSLIESVLILPSHMGHSLQKRDKSKPNRFTKVLAGYEHARDRIIQDGVLPLYEKVLRWCLKYRYVSLSIALATFMSTMGMIASGKTEFEFLPSSDSETLIINLRMPVGTPIDETKVVVEKLELASSTLPEVVSTWTILGVQVNGDDLFAAGGGKYGSHLAQLYVELQAVEYRDEFGLRNSQACIDAIRAAAQPLDGVERLSFTEIQGGPGGTDITIEIAGKDLEEVNRAVEETKFMLAEFEGVYDIADDNADGQREIRIELLPGAAAMGFTVNDVAQQVRASLFGIDAHVFSDRQEDIDVRVRLDETSRRSLNTIENLWLIAQDGRRVPINEIATLSEAIGYSTIQRVDRRRTVTVTADTASDVNPEEIVRALDIDGLRNQYPQLDIGFGGRQEQMAEAFGSLPIGFGAAMVMIFVILAWLFGSYTQPLAVMLGIPFAFIGVVWGHYLLGYKLTFLSIIGFVALSGIVVNDSLILVEFFNQKRREGVSLVNALALAGRARFRAIGLTTITTVLGLTPFMLEKSFQAKFLIPMAVAISFGLMSATFLILLVLPCILVIFDDIRGVVYYLWHGLPRPRGDDGLRSSFELETE